jgi:hypothetical protein
MRKRESERAGEREHEITIALFTVARALVIDRVSAMDVFDLL